MIATYSLRAASGLLALATFAAVCTWGGQARSQEASALDFYRSASVVPHRIIKPSVRSKSSRIASALPSPPPFIRGRLVCAANVNRYLAKMGKPTTGSLAAISFVGHGRRADRYTPGAVQVSRRKGGNHAEIVAGGGMCMNPSALGQRWALVSCYSRRNVIGWWVA